MGIRNVQGDIGEDSFEEDKELVPDILNKLDNNGDVIIKDYIIYEKEFSEKCHNCGNKDINRYHSYNGFAIKTNSFRNKKGTFWQDFFFCPKCGFKQGLSYRIKY